MTLYYRLFLHAPILLAIITALVPALRGFGIFQVAVAIIFAGGIPYLFFIASALFWSVSNADVNHAKAFAFSPFAFGFFCFSYGLALAYADLSNPQPLFVGLGVASTYAVFGFFVSAVISWSALGIWWLIAVVRKRM